MANQTIEVPAAWLQRIEEKLDALIGEPQEFGQTLDVKEAAAFLQIDINTVYRWTRSGKLPHVKVGRRYYYYKSELDDWMRGR